MSGLARPPNFTPRGQGPRQVRPEPRAAASQIGKGLDDLQARQRGTKPGQRDVLLADQGRHTRFERPVPVAIAVLIRGLALDFLVRKLRHGAWIDEDDERSLRALYEGVRLVHARGDIIREGATPRFLTLVLEGWACTYRDLGNGQRQILSILLPGDLAEPFGILPDFADHSIDAVTQVTLAQVNPDAIRAAASASPRIEQALWWDLLVTIAIEREHAVSLGRRTASERLGHLLCELHLRQALVGLAEGASCEFPLTQSELADLLGLSAVHVNRSLQDLRGRGLVSLRNRRLIIHELEALRNFSFFDPDYLHADTDALHSGELSLRGE